MYTYLTPNELRTLELDDDPLPRHAREDIRTLAQELLLLKMQGFGRDVLNDPADSDLSYFLWRTLEDPQRITEEQAEELIRLSETCEGWWLIGSDRFPEFMGLEVWKTLYAEFQ